MADQTSLTQSGGLAFLCRLVVTIFFTVAGLSYGAGVLVPLSLAVLVFVLITALIDRIKSHAVFGFVPPNWLANLLAFAVVAAGISVILSILSSQAASVSEAMPRYEARFSDIISRLAALIGEDAFAAAERGVAEMNISTLATGAISSAGGMLSGLFLMILYIAFLMVERKPLGKKLALALPDPDTYHKVLSLGNSMSESLQRYVGIKSFVSLLTAIGSYVFMKPVGLDFAETWAVMAFLLNFIPTIGSMVAVVLPSIVALVQFETLGPILIVVCGCGVVQFGVGNVLEPSLTGRSLNLSPFLVILALTFWSTVWGIPGALMSVPITVCIMIVLSHIPATRALAIFMSGDGSVDGDLEPDGHVQNSDGSGAPERPNSSETKSHEGAD